MAATYYRVVGYSADGKIGIEWAYTTSRFKKNESDPAYTNNYKYMYHVFATGEDSPTVLSGRLSMSFWVDNDTKSKYEVNVVDRSRYDTKYYYIDISSKDGGYSTGDRYHTVHCKFTFPDGTIVEDSYVYDCSAYMPQGWTEVGNIKLYANGQDLTVQNSFCNSNVEFGQTFSIRIGSVNPGFYYNVVIRYPVDTSASTTRYYEYTLLEKVQSTQEYTVSVPLSIINNIEKNANRQFVDTMRLEQYSGDYNEYTKDILQEYNRGYVYGHFYLTVPDTLTPNVSITASEHTSGLPSGLTFFVTKRSTAEVRINASGQYGATIQSISSTFEGTQYNGNSFVTNTFGKTGNYVVTATVTDSRGKVTTKTHTLTVKDWTEPKLTLCRGYRCASANDPTESPDGAFICVRCNGSVAPVDNENAMTCIVNYKAQESSSTSSATVGTTGYTMNQAYAIFPATIGSDYDITVVLRDRFTQTTYICARVPATGALIHIKKNKKGMGLFRRAPSNADGLYIAGNTDITGGLNIHGLIQADGTIVAQKTLNQMHAQALQQYNTATTPAADDYIPIISFKTSTGYMTLCAHPADGTMCVINYNSSSGQATVTSL